MGLNYSLKDSILITQATKIAPKECKYCKLTHIALPETGVLYRNILYFNCNCGNTLGVKHGKICPEKTE